MIEKRRIGRHHGRKRHVDEVLEQRWRTVGAVVADVERVRERRPQDGAEARRERGVGGVELVETPSHIDLQAPVHAHPVFEKHAAGHPAAVIRSDGNIEPVHAE